jgi:hypothetical protein
LAWDEIEYNSIGYNNIIGILMEIWSDVPLFGGKYQASNLGNIRAKEHNVKKYSHFFKKIIVQTYKQRMLKPTLDKSGYYRVHLGIDGKKHNYSVHRMVLMAFVGMPKDGDHGCHNNGISTDNRLENLRWDTPLENAKDRVRHGAYKRGKEHPMYGKKMSAELKQKLLSCHLGVKRSDELRKKMSEAQKIRWANVQKQKTA